MRNVRIYLAIAIVLTFFGAGLWFNPIYASEQIAGNEVVVKDRVVEEDLLAAGSNVQIQSEIRRDLTVAGSNVSVSGPVGGYVMAAGSNIVIRNSVGNDLWAAGSTVTVSGAVGDNASVAGGTVNLQPGSSINSDARIAGGTITVQGRIGRNLNLAGGSVQIGSEVVGNVDASVGRLTVMPGAIIRGNLVVHGTHPPDISPEAQVLGQVEFHQSEQRSSWLSWLYWWLYCFLALLFTGVAVLLLSRVWANRVATTITTKPLYSLLAGFVGVLLTPIVIIFLSITLIGIPLALVLLSLFCVLMILSGVFVAYLVGVWILGLIKRPQASPWLRMCAGSLVVSFAASLPWVGWLVVLVVLLFGFGASSLERWGMRRQLRGEGAL